MATETQGAALLGAQEVTKRYGAQTVLNGVSVTIHEGDRIGLIGKNGSGKSTFMRILAGAEPPDGGLVTRRNLLRVAMLTQRCEFDKDRHVGDILRAAADELRSMVAEYHHLNEVIARGEGTPEVEARAHHLEHELELSGAWHLDTVIKRVTTELALPPEDRLAGTLSGGEQRRVDLAATLIRRPDVLLLDEPTNHIDPDSVRWIESYLAGYPGTVVLITHDRYFLDRAANRIVELLDGNLTAFQGTYDDYLEQKAIRESFEARTESNRLATIQRELAWRKRGPKARGTKQKARIGRLEALQAIQAPPRDKNFDFAIPQPGHLGKRVIEADVLAKTVGGRELFTGFSFIVQKGMRVGVIGPNGCGKTTLLRTLMGTEEPDRGELFIGETVKFLYVDQRHEDINPQDTILKHVSNGADYVDVDGQRIYVPTYLERFLFDRATLHMPMENLSGGEHNRIDLAKKLMRGGNVLVLDEPTNDLDLQTLRVLEEAVLAFEGATLIVSHDRYFLNRLCNHMLSFEADGRVVHVAGNYDDYLRWSREQEEAAKQAARENAPPREKKSPRSDRPRRLTYKEKVELERMEERLLEAEEHLQQLEAEINEPAFYERSHDKVQASLQAFEDAKARVEQLYDRWSELEAIAGQD